MEFDELEKIVEFLGQAEKKADEKIAILQYSKSKIQSAKADYERKLQAKQNFNGTFLKDFPERVILLLDTLEVPTLIIFGIISATFMIKSLPHKKSNFPLSI